MARGRARGSLALLFTRSRNRSHDGGAGRTRRQTLRAAERVLGAGLVLGPLVYAVSLDREPVIETCEAPAVVSVEDCVAQPPTTEPVPVPVVEPAIEIEATPEPEPVDPSTLAQLLPVTANGIVLSLDAEAKWSTGRFYEPPGDASFRVAKRAAIEKLPEQLSSWSARSFDLYGPEGKLCTARVSNLHVISQYDGWGIYGLVEDEQDSSDLDTYERPSDIPPSRWRTRVWRTQPHWLVGEFESDGDCSGALWARDAALPAPTVLRPSDAPNPVADARVATFEHSTELAELRREYRAWYAALPEEAKEWEPSWSKLARENPASVRSWTDGAGVHVLELSFGSDSEGCGDGYDAELTAVDLVKPGRFVATEHETGIAAVFDADLDGRWELLYEPSYDTEARVVSETQALRYSFSIDRDWECPC